MSEIKRLKFNDASSFEDAHKISASEAMKMPGMPLRGRVVMKDELGNVLLEKDNMIVLRGRTFALEKLFNDTISSTSGYKMDLNRHIVLFKIGSGGADVAAAPFDPFVPMYQDEDLHDTVPFLTVDPNKNTDPAKQSNPSIVTALSPGDENVYYNAVPRTGEPGVIDYFGKVFETQPEWYFDKASNEVYKKITLRINTKDARNQYINELGLYFAQYDSATNAYKNIEIFSRICFDTESLTNLTKQIVIEYFIYA